MEFEFDFSVRNFHSDFVLLPPSDTEVKLFPAFYRVHAFAEIEDVTLLKILRDSEFWNFYIKKNQLHLVN